MDVLEKEKNATRLIWQCLYIWPMTDFKESSVGMFKILLVLWPVKCLTRCVKKPSIQVMCVIPGRLMVTMYLSLHIILSSNSGFANTPNLGHFTPKLFRWLRQGYRGITSTSEMFGNKQGATSTPEIFGKKHSFVLTFFATNTIYLNCKRCRP